MGMTIPEKVWVWEGGKYPDNNKRIWTPSEYDELGDGMWGGDYYFRGDYVEKLEAKLAEAIEGLRFYAEQADYEEQLIVRDCGCCSYLDNPIILDDKGNLARKVLKKLEKTE
jgi:glutamate synthase domain-containing protein 3